MPVRIGSRYASTPAVAERNFGRPAGIYRVAGQLILVYDKNLLAGLPPPRPVEAS